MVRSPGPGVILCLVMFRILLTLLACATAAQSAGFQPADYQKLRSVGSVQFSPDGLRLAYSVTRNDGPRSSLSQLWIMTLADGKSISMSAGDEPSGSPEWSPDGKYLYFTDQATEKIHKINLK